MVPPPGKRRTVKTRGQAPRLAEVEPAAFAAVRRAARVERLAYTRTQAAQALGVSRSTLTRRVLPLVETIDMPWGTRLIPADELERLIAQRRHPAQAQAHAPARAGRPAAISQQTVEQIQAAHGAGKTLAQIARDLNTARIPTAHGGARWWPSTVRAVVNRVSA